MSATSRPTRSSWIPRPPSLKTTIIAPTATSSVTINNNDGVIKGEISTDSGATVLPGVAISTINAPSGTGLQDPVTINLNGGATPAFVEGDIDMRAQDTINVNGGETDYAGVINNDATSLDITKGVPSYVGTLNINSGGDLYLEDRVLTPGGPEYAAGGFVNAFNDNAGSTLTMELPALAPGAVFLSNPEIFANKATLAGTLVLRPDLQLFANQYVYTIVNTTQNIADPGSTGGVITGAFTDSANVTQPSVLLDAVVSYTPSTAVLTVNRVPFNGVPGLTINQRSAGSGIEHVYSQSLTGPFANLVLTCSPRPPRPTRALWTSWPASRTPTTCKTWRARLGTSIGSSTRKSTAPTTISSTRRARPRTAAIRTRARCGAASPARGVTTTGTSRRPSTTPPAGLSTSVATTRSTRTG